MAKYSIPVQLVFSNREVYDWLHGVEGYLLEQSDPKGKELLAEFDSVKESIRIIPDAVLKGRVSDENLTGPEFVIGDGNSPEPCVQSDCPSGDCGN